MRFVWRFGALAAVASLLSACGSTTDFAKPISDFGAATETASAAFTGYADTLEKLNQAHNVSKVLKNPELLERVGCKLTGLPQQCALTVGGQAFKPKFLVNTRSLMAAIVTYSKTLKAIATADDIAKLKTAADAIPADVNALAKAVDTLSAQTRRPTKLAPQVAAISSPVGEIITIALTKYAEHEKLKALYGATARMDRIFVEAMRVMSFVAATNQENTNFALSIQFSDAREAYAAALGAYNKKRANPPKAVATEAEKEKEKEKEDAAAEHNKQLKALQEAVREALDQYEKAAEGFNVGLTAKPHAVFAKLAELHGDLVEALESPDADFQTVFKRIQEFAQIASLLVANVKKIDEALHPKTSS